MAGGLSALNAMAQAVPTPGTVLEMVRPQAPVSPEPKDAPALVLPAAPEPSKLDPNAPRTRISAFRIIGNQTVPTATLEGLIAGRAGKPYNLYELQKVTRVISDYYHDKGYPVARAVIPAQKVEAGVLTIEVIEGRIEKAQFNGNKHYRSAFLSRWTAPLNGKPVQTLPLEERILTINDLPGMTARAVLVPGTVYGTTIVDMDVHEKPADGQISVNNSGRKEVGEYRVDASANLNNPLGIGDQLGLRASYSEQGLVKMLGVNYSLPLNVQGTRLSVNYMSVHYGIGGELADLDINGKSTLGAVTVIHPFVRRQNENLFGTFGFRYFGGNQDTSGIPITANRTLVAEAGMAWNHIDHAFNVVSGSLRVSSNFRGEADGERNDRQKYKIDGDASWLLHLAKAWDLKLAGSAQLSSAALADSEKFSLGGPTSVRGYAAADVRGDRGAFASAELRYRPAFIRVPSYFSVFYDAGYAARRGAQAGTPPSNTIGSAGVGFSVVPTRNVSIDIAAAVPTTTLDPSDNRNGGRLWVNLTTSF